MHRLIFLDKFKDLLRKDYSDNPEGINNNDITGKIYFRIVEFVNLFVFVYDRKQHQIEVTVTG